MVVKAAAASGRGRRVYSQSQPPLINAPVKQVASFIVPAGVFVAVTFADSFVEIGGETSYAEASKV